MTDKIFQGLEKLGFNDASKLKLYKNEENKEKKLSNNSYKDENFKVTSLLYKKTVTCPVCNKTFKAIAVKSSAYRLDSRDADFFMRYSLINPYFYDVWLCETCGYTSMKGDFFKIKSREIDLIKENITKKWHTKKYPDIYDINIAIERYKISLLNYVVMDSKTSKKAINCLKIAWMYRLIDSKEARKQEMIFLKEALKGIEYAYYNEYFPIYGMDTHTIMYLIGELNRRIGNYDESLLWFSNIVTTPKVSAKLKEMARTQKDLAKEELRTLKMQSCENITEDYNDNIRDETTDNEEDSLSQNSENKRGFLSKIFKK